MRWTRGCGRLAIAWLLSGGWTLAIADDWTKLAPIPDLEGFAGAFAGVSHGVLLVAGGANFPEKPPWEGGRKVWYDTVFALREPGAAWTQVGRLPRPRGYGVSTSYENTLICVGGGDAERHHADAFRLEWVGGELRRSPLPSLPVPMAQGCGVLVGETLYVAGGQESPEVESAMRRAWAIDLSSIEPNWRELPPWPGPARMLAVVASHEGAFHLVGGVELVSENGKVGRRYLKDAYRYEEKEGWTRLADLPTAMAAAPSPAPTVPGGFLVLGGDDGSQVGAAPDAHRGFARSVWKYNAMADRWETAGSVPAPRVTVPCVSWRQMWVVPSGEVRPGVRSPEVWALFLGAETP